MLKEKNNQRPFAHPKNSPSAIWLSILRWFCPPELNEGIEGDLLEQFESDVEIMGLGKARKRFALRVINFFRPGIILRNKFSIRPTSHGMLGNYLKVATRNIQKRKLYSFINAFGLSIGFAFCMLIYLYIQDEKSFDQFHEKKDRIFMITEMGIIPERLKDGNSASYRYSAYLPAKLAEVMQDELPEVKHATRFAGGEGIMRYRDKIFKQEASYADSGFFQMFSFKILQGSINKLFRNTNDAVLTPEVARKYFGDEDPVGKVFTFEGKEQFEFTVAAVIEAPPANSSIDFKMLLPIAKRPSFANSRDNWGSFSYPTFVQLHDESSPQSFGESLDKIAVKYMGDRMKNWREREKLPADFKVADFEFTSLNDIHLNTRIGWHRVSDPKYSYILGSIAVFILLIASINYISLALTTSAARRVEVGIRKVVGAQKSQLIYQFGFESIVLALLSMFIGTGLVGLFLPAFNEFTGKSIQFSSLGLLQLSGVSISITLLIGILAGSYPAFFLSGFLPVTVLKGRLTSKLEAGFTRPLVVLQFALSAFLIFSSVIMYRQMKYVTTKDLGYKKEQILVVPAHGGSWGNKSSLAIERFRNKIRSETAVLGVAGTSASFNQGWSRYGYKIKDEHKAAYVYSVDLEYIELLGIELIAGRNFDERIASDSSAVIVNEALVKDLGWKDPLNEYLNWKEDSLGLGSRVIGVVMNYHFLPLEEEIEPMFLSLENKDIGYLMTMMVKVSGDNIPESVDRVRAIWTELNPDKPFEYTFLDEDVAKQYDKYNRWTNITGLSTAFAILIASLGLFGLAGMNALNKTKEIGIRKVMGAEIMNIFVLLNKQYIWMAMISFSIAAPFSWYVMNKWLADFQFKITMGWELFGISMLSGLLVALLTVSYHAVKAALVNPADTLKYE